MKIIMALDNRNGLMFNHRRQSQDARVREEIRQIVGRECLYLNSYSAEQFKNSGISLCVNEGFLKCAGHDTYCFVENVNMAAVKENIEEFIIFRWNRSYPADSYPDVMPDECNMTCIDKKEFQGNSHENITMEIWEKNR